MRHVTLPTLNGNTWNLDWRSAYLCYHRLERNVSLVPTALSQSNLFTWHKISSIVLEDMSEILVWLCTNITDPFEYHQPSFLI
jgi:hypothetical protein